MRHSRRIWMQGGKKMERMRRKSGYSRKTSLPRSESGAFLLPVSCASPTPVSADSFLPPQQQKAIVGAGESGELRTQQQQMRRCILTSHPHGETPSPVWREAQKIAREVALRMQIGRGITPRDADDAVHTRGDVDECFLFSRSLSIYMRMYICIYIYVQKRGVYGSPFVDSFSFPPTPGCRSIHTERTQRTASRNADGTT